MKKTSARCRNKKRDKEDREEEGEDNVESSSSIHLGVKMELQGHVEGSGGVVEEVVEAPWDEITDTTLVDLTQQFNKVFVQTTFNSFKEFEKLFNKFKAETGSVFRIKSSCSIAYENSRRKKHLIPSRFKFVTVRYCCVHYGQPKVAGQGIRTKQRYLPCGCESVLSVSYNRGALVISQANMRHNHEVSSEMAPFYAINRRISNAELREVANVVEMIPSSRALQHFLQIHFRRPTTLQDAKNVRTRLKALKLPQTTTRQSSESGTGLFEEEEEEEVEVQDEDTVMDGIDEGVDFRVQEEVVRRVEGSDRNYWEENTICKATKRQQYQEEEEVVEEVIGNREEEEEQEPQIDPAMRGKVLSEIKTKLFSAIQNCNARVFQERVSVIERLIEGWENGDPVHIQYMEENEFEVKTFEPINAISRNTNSTQERIQNQNANSHTSVNNINIALPVNDTRGESHFLPSQTNEKLSKVEYESQATGMANVNSSIPEHKSLHDNSNQHYRTDAHCLRGMERRKNIERRPIILSIMKGFVGGCDQAVEVEIEVDGEVAKVKTVKREPLDYYEVNVGD